MSTTNHTEHNRFPSKPRPSTIHLRRIGTSCPSTPSYTPSSGMTSQITQTRTSNHALNLPSAMQLFEMEPLPVRELHPGLVQTAHLASLAVHARQSNGQASPGRPPLSARSASFVFAMQQCSKLFSSVLENYLHSSTSHSFPSLSSQTACFRSVFSSGENTHCPPLSNARRVIILISSLLITFSILAPAILLPRLPHDHSRMGTHMVMGSSSAVIFLSATIMLSARRSPKEILAMAAVGVTICQCVMGDLSSGP